MYEFSWYVPESVLLLKLIGAIELDEFKAINQTLITDYANASNDDLVLVIDLSQASNFAISMPDLVRESAAITQSDQIRHRICVGINSPLAKFSANVATSAGRQPFHVVDTMTEANQLLHTLGIQISSSSV